MELRERGEQLLNNFLKLWPMITTSYQPLEREVELVSLDDEDIEFTGRKLAGFTYQGEQHHVTVWKDLLVDVCKLLYHEKPTEMLYLATKDYCLHPKQKDNNTKVAEDCYVWSANSTKAKRAILTYIFKQIGISPSELVIGLVPETDTTNEDIEE